MPFDSDKFKQELDSLGYDAVQEKLLIDKAWYNYEPRLGLAQDWIRRKDEARTSATASRAEERASRAEIRAIEADRIALRDSRIAIIAVIVAIISLADDISKLFP